MAASLGQEFCTLRDTYIEKQFGRLNDMQRQAVFTTDGPLLILAGAGSGKTTVLVNRIANLIRFGSAHGSKETPRPVTEEDVKALRTAIMTGTDAPSWLDGMLRRNAVRSWNVMAITFTNKAAGELKERLRRMLGGEEGDEVFASTFHSACVRILRRWAEEIGYPRSFTIYDTDDAQRVMKTVYKELSIDDKFLPIKAAINQMSRWKDQLVSPEQALADHARDVKSTQTARIYAAYEKKLKEAGAFDFDDLIYQTVQLLAEHPDVREFYQNKYRYLLVDEYQDTSVAQFRLVSLLTGPERNICVVGDDDQSIYRFRGATIENILNFEKLYPGTKTLDDAALRPYLETCRIAYLWDKLHEEGDWSHILSIGEQQRLAFARALIYAPRWLFLDEASSALDERTEGEVYAALARECPGTTYVSVGHRSTLVKFHQDVIYLDKETQTLRRPSAIPRGREEAGR